MNKRISVVIPVYNVEKYISQCIESIINQTYRNLEIILVDDGSSDDSGKICDKYAKKDKRIKVIHKKNGGVSSARNVGLKNSSGAYISFVDGDDYIEKETYGELIEIFNNNVMLDAIKFQYQKLEKGKITYKSSNSSYGLLNINKHNILEHQIMYNEFANCWSFIFKKEKIIDYFNEDLIMAEDYYFVTNFLINSNYIYITDKSYYYYINNALSITNNFNNNVFYKRMLSHLFVDKNIYNLLVTNNFKDLYLKEIKKVYKCIISNLKTFSLHNDYDNYITLIFKLKKSNDFKYFYTLDRRKYDKNIYKHIRINYLLFKFEANIKKMLINIIRN